jgi:DNA-nicking Smr family endonuclease
MASSTSRLSLNDLSDLKGAMKKAAHIAAKARAEAEAQERAAKAISDEFRRAVGAVTPLQVEPKAMTHRPRPSAMPARLNQAEKNGTSAADATMTSIALSDDFDTQNVLNIDDPHAFRREHIGEDVLKKLRKGHWPVKASIDLHGCSRDQAREDLVLFIRTAMRKGLRCVRVIHGKGLGSQDQTPILREKVRNWLVQQDDVLAFMPASAAEGGAGVLIVLLKPVTATPTRRLS